MALQPFFNTRAKAVPFGGQSALEGWVSPDSDGVLILEVEDPVELMYKSLVRAQLNTLKFSSQFACEFIGAEGTQCILSLPPAIPRHPGRNEARYRGLVRTANCLYPGDERPIRVTDVSVAGIGLQTTESMEIGSILPLQIVLESGLVEFDWQCLYAKEIVAGGETFWRSGGKILAIGRTDQVRWRNFLLSHS